MPPCLVINFSTESSFTLFDFDLQKLLKASFFYSNLLDEFQAKQKFVKIFRNGPNR